MNPDGIICAMKKRIIIFIKKSRDRKRKNNKGNEL